MQPWVPPSKINIIKSNLNLLSLHVNNEKTKSLKSERECINSYLT